MWWLQQDPHSADGLRFHWGGSQSNRSLLRCLGVGAENTVSVKLGLRSTFKDEVTDEEWWVFLFCFLSLLTGYSRAHQRAAVSCLFTRTQSGCSKHFPRTAGHTCTGNRRHAGKPLSFCFFFQMRFVPCLFQILK